MNCKKNANSNPGEERQLFHPESEKVVEIGLERLRPFKNHPFKVKEDEAMAQLMESIERYGILNPLIVMPTREGVYQIVSGHRRKYCAEKLGYTQVPVIIRYMKEEDSIISMVDSNLHRDKILFSEKAFAYYMKNEAMKRKTGKRRRTQEGQLESIKGTKTIQLIGKETGESPRQVLRYIRLTLLVPELLDMLDEGKISFNPAVELSFLSEVEQKWVLNGMDYAQAAPSVSQAKRIKALSQEKMLTQQKINEILSEIKKSDMSRVIFKNSQMYKYFPRYYSAEQMKEEIIALLEKDYKRKERQRKKEEKKAGQGSSATDQNYLHGKEAIKQTTDY
ncbi:ParB/RepB/Spo0J family partition protein [Lachnospiraceae bacterium SGI.231]